MSYNLKRRRFYDTNFCLYFINFIRRYEKQKEARKRKTRERAKRQTMMRGMVKFGNGERSHKGRERKRD